MLMWRIGILALLLAASRAAGQECCGDCNSDGQVAINELTRTVRYALQGCSAACCGDCNGDHQMVVSELITHIGYALTGCPSPCPIRFTDNNLGELDPVCRFQSARTSNACNELIASFYTDGTYMLARVSTEPILFVGARVTNPVAAAILGWWTVPDLSDFQEAAGTITLDLAVTDRGAPERGLLRLDGEPLPQVNPSTHEFAVRGVRCNLYRGGSFERTFPDGKPQIHAMLERLAER